MEGDLRLHGKSVEELCNRTDGGERMRAEKATADPSTPFAAKYAANSAQDDSDDGANFRLGTWMRV
jgi:hypothetical protein